jgi:hypothetical protein
VYEPPSSGGAQIHDFNPGITQAGVFWTTVVAADSVHVGSNLDSASLQVADLAQKDYTDLENALFGGQPVTPGRVSFRVEWTATGPVQHVDNPVQHYRADVRPAEAKMEWSAQTVDYTFQSAPLATSSSVDAGAELADEANGSYY